MKKVLLSFLSLIYASFVMAQAGETVFTFLELPVSARSAALGGSNVSIYDGDLNLAFNNPALLSKATDRAISFNFCNYLDDIKFGSVGVGYNVGLNYFAFALHYVDYGVFDGRDASDQAMGTFSAQDMALSLSYAHPLNKHWTAGLSLKPIYSHLETYTSYGLAFDGGVSYHSSNKLSTAGLAIRNMGWQFQGYESLSGTDGQYDLPFNVILGYSQRFAHAPLRISLTLHHLNDWDMDYLQSYTVSEDETLYDDPSDGEKFLRHLIVSAEILFSPNFYATIGYNNKRQGELALVDVRNASGFSFGVALRVKGFHVGLAMSPYQTGITSYQFTLTTDLNKFIK